MDFSIESKDGVAVLTLNETHLDNTLSALLKAELLILVAQQDGPLIIDLKNVRTCDADGLGALLVAQRTLNDAGRTLKIAGGNSAFRKLLAMSRLTGVFELFSSARAARLSCVKPKRKSAARIRGVRKK